MDTRGGVDVRERAEILERALASEQEPDARCRMTFELARLWLDCGEKEKALAAFLERAKLAGSAEQRFVSLRSAGNLKEGLGHPDVEIIGTYLKAFEACPWRAESLYDAARYCRITRNFHQGYMLAKQGLALRLPRSGLLFAQWIYDYGLLDEFAINAFWAGWNEESLEACEVLLAERKMPEDWRPRVETNARHARDKLTSAVFSKRNQAILRSRLRSVLTRLKSYQDDSPSHRPAASDPQEALRWFHVINLDRSPDRFRRFCKFNRHLEGVVRVSAVDGQDPASMDKERLISDGIITPELRYPLGSLACALSHINLWKMAVAENRSMTIFEDDAIVSYRFQEMAAMLMATLPGQWDIVKWAYSHENCFAWLDFDFAKAKLEFYDWSFSGDDILRFQSADYPWSLVKFRHSFGTVAYSVSPKGAQILLQRLLPLKQRSIPFPGTRTVIWDNGIDCAINGVYPLMQAYHCNPPLVLHDEDLVSDRIAAN